MRLPAWSFFTFPSSVPSKTFWTESLSFTGFSDVFFVTSHYVVQLKREIKGQLYGVGVKIHIILALNPVLNIHHEKLDLRGNP
jgi:hypothetical protein